MKDTLGDRMKEQYEHRTRYYLPRRTYTIIRADGKAFHTFTKGMQRPYDLDLIAAMNFTTAEMCNEIQGVCFGYCQSDEISLLLTDFAAEGTAAWYDGNVQKIASVSASIATAWFNGYWSQFEGSKKAFFDSRVFTIPDPTEVYNYFVWRQKDAIRNSIQMKAQSIFTPRELQGKSCEQLKGMMIEAGKPWEDESPRCQRGNFFEKVVRPHTIEKTPEVKAMYEKVGKESPSLTFMRGFWESVDMPVLTEDPNWLMSRIPKYGDEGWQ